MGTESRLYCTGVPALMPSKMKRKKEEREEKEEEEEGREEEEGGGGRVSVRPNKS